MVFDFGQQPFDFEHIAPLQAAMSRDEPPFNFRLETGGGGGDERALLSRGLRIPELCVEPRNVTVLDLAGAVPREGDVQMLADVSEGLLRELRLLAQASATRSLGGAHQSLIEGVALPGHLRQ